MVERGGPEKGRKKARPVQANVGGASVGGDEGGEEAPKQWGDACLPAAWNSPNLRTVSGRKSGVLFYFCLIIERERGKGGDTQRKGVGKEFVKICRYVGCEGRAGDFLTRSSGGSEAIEGVGRCLTTDSSRNNVHGRSVTGNRGDNVTRSVVGRTVPHLALNLSFTYARARRTFSRLVSPATSSRSNPRDEISNQPVLAAPELSFLPALSFHGNLTTVEAFIRIFSWTLEDNLSRSCFC
ncbi:unnamed protein product [Calypogeia fissa]